MAVCVRDDGLRSVTFCASTKRRLVRWGVPGRRRRVVRRRFVHREVSCIGKGWGLGDEERPPSGGVVHREVPAVVSGRHGPGSAFRGEGPVHHDGEMNRVGRVPRTWGRPMARTLWRADPARCSAHGKGPTPLNHSAALAASSVPRTGPLFRARGREFQAGTGPRAGVSGSSRTGRRSRSPPP